MSSYLHQAFLDVDDINLLSRVLDKAGYDRAAAPESFALAAEKALALFKRGVRREDALLAALRAVPQDSQNGQQIDDPLFERRFAVQGLPPSGIGNVAGIIGDAAVKTSDTSR